MEFDIFLTAELQRSLLRKRMFRRWPLLLVASALLATCSLLSWERGGSNPIAIIGLLSNGTFILILAFSYWGRCRSIREWHTLQGDTPVHFHVDEDAIRASSRMGSSEIKWFVFKELRIGDGYLLLHTAQAGPLPLPTKDVPAEALAFIQAKFQSLGLPIRRV